MVRRRTWGEQNCQRQNANSNGVSR